jgi:hypothetical protein
MKGVSFALLLGLASIGFATDPVLENPHLLVVFDESDGSIIRCQNKDASLDWIGDSSFSAPAWMVALLDSNSVYRYRLFDCRWTYLTSASADSFSYEFQEDSTRLEFFWFDSSSTTAIEASAEIDSIEPRIDFQIEVSLADPSHVVARSVYPIISGVKSLGSHQAQDRLTVLSELALQRPFWFWDSSVNSVVERDILAHHIFGYEIIDPCAAPASVQASEIPYYFPDANGQIPDRYYFWWDRTDSERFIFQYLPSEGGFFLANTDGYYDTSRWCPKFVRLRRLTTGTKPNSWRDILSIEVHHTEPDSSGHAILVATSGGYWEEGAFLYRGWSQEQSWWPAAWAERLEADPAQASSWLLDSTGIAIFAPCFSRNISSHMAVIADSLGGRILWIPSVDWPAILWRYEDNPKPPPPDSFWVAHAQGGYQDSLGAYWFPTSFDSLDLHVVEETGGHFAPFIFPAAIDASLQCYQDTSSSEGWMLNKAQEDLLSNPLMCWWTEGPPGADSLGWKAFNTWRTARLGSFQNSDSSYTGSADGVYWDINSEARCFTLSGRHDHELAVSDNASAMEEAKDSLGSVIEGYAPAGSENLYERWFPVYDFNQARAWAWPQVVSEYDGRFGTSGNSRGRLLPLWECIAHECAPIRLDGWGALSGDSTSDGQYGDILYFLLGRTLVWGGLPELNYEWAAIEGFGWAADSCDTTYEASYYWTPHTVVRGSNVGWFDGDSRQLSFATELAKARCGFCNRFVVFGRMMREPEFRFQEGDAETVELSWRRYNTTGLHTSGTEVLPRVIGSSWKHSDTLGVVLLNASVEAIDTLSLYLNPVYWGLGGEYSYRRILSSGSPSAVIPDSTGWARIGIPSRQIVLIEGAPVP